MEKYKICPACQTKNPPTLFECANCETDLTAVKITDESQEKAVAMEVFQQQQPLVKAVKVCECGAKNPANARKCHACNEDISDLLPTAGETPQQKVFALSSIDGQVVYKVEDNEVIVGRENQLSQYLASKCYVSRAHARLIRAGDYLYVENLSNTNFTYVNNQKITAKTKLADGDELGLGGTSLNGNRQQQAAYFLVRIK